jgi:hypothetical protein
MIDVGNDSETDSLSDSGSDAGLSEMEDFQSLGTEHTCGGPGMEQHGETKSMIEVW